MGTHDVFVADIVSVSADDGIIDKDGKIRFDRANLLAYAHGEYFALGEKVGRFGFSTDKPKSVRSDKRQVSAKREESGEEKHRPFYLDAPRSKSRTKPRTKRGGKK